ncbi:MAG: hypothetical protein SP1CHLAM54_15500 [Chlamydiia bacterium]|nr:hypothetical protein [Chlamydiia bacterium]MCH9616440.1 hypothetical protein [Chlamydiia bacterium]MCH9629574.1 hypothetical protein [Chlamydiia bacterium]
MRKEVILVLILIPLALLVLFLPKGNSSRKITIHDDFFTLLGKQTESWNYINKKSDLVDIGMFEEVYEKHKARQFMEGLDFRIPKIVHFIWVGPKNFPRESIENIRTWIAHHPDWTFKFWTDRNRPPPCNQMQVHYLDDFHFQYLKDKYEEAENWAEKSDILRYEILYQQGGIYADHDANCLKPFHNLNKGYDFFACLELPHPAVDDHVVTAGIGIIGSKPQHPIIRGCIDLVSSRWHAMSDKYRDTDPSTQRERVLHRTYMAMTYSLKEHLGNSETIDIVFPASYFYAKRPLPSIYSEHFYGASWEKGGDMSFLKGLSGGLHELRHMQRDIMRTVLFTMLLVAVCALVYWRRYHVCLIPLLFLFGCSTDEQDFYKMMGERKTIETIEDTTNLEIFKNIYERNHEFYAGETLIPKTMHFIWFGPRSFPKDFRENVKGWTKKHPDWSFKFWTDRPRKAPVKGMEVKLISDFEFDKVGELFVRARNYREKADLLRFEILHQEGGVCIDYNLKCLRSISLMGSSYTFFCGLLPPCLPTLSSYVSASCDIIGAVPRHPAVEKTLDQIIKVWSRVESAFPGDDKESIIYRTAHRIFSPFNTALKTTLDTDANRDIVFPSSMFHGRYAETDLAWLDGTSKEERAIKKKLKRTVLRNRQILLFTQITLVLTLTLLICLCFHKKSSELSIKED